MLPTLTGVGRLVDDPELRFTQSNKAVATVRLAFNSRRLNPQTNQWEDGDTFWVRGTLWEKLAENAAETLAKGMEVCITGELRTEQWEKDGQKHSQPSLLIRSIGPNLAYATASVTKAGAQQQRPAPQQQRRQGPPQDDPWATGPSTSEEPPF
ncbi:single-stranded DNA-binding protein [Streptomyces murinus]|uniref:single-stranded DNA-binding protein n=1 Tax=Streptomyces murinus TaxID=33900 RepID=UPI002E0EB8E1|nr:single-stranded DNA-binding protein [Streptomyces murinus]WSI86566.1 single-stranded DNA-binding protein [Streptomyces murinus]